jgi:glycosyltransferase involved in cell wall biosynthesis
VKVSVLVPVYNGEAFLAECSRVIELRKYFKPGVMNGRRVIVRCLERLSNMIGKRRW